MDEQPGFLVPEPVVTLTLTEDPYKGAEVRTRVRLSPRLYHGIKDVMERRTAVDTTLDQMVDLTHEASVIFAASGLISWNLVDPATSEPLPPTIEGLDELDIRVSGRIISTWVAWLGKAPLPLPETSSEPTVLPTRRSRKPRSSTAGGPTAAASRPKSTRSRTSSPSSVSAA